MTPLAAETRMPAVAPEALVGPVTPEAAIRPVTPKSMPVAAIGEAPIHPVTPKSMPVATIGEAPIHPVTPKSMPVATIGEAPMIVAIPEPALAIMALVTDAARAPMEIPVEMSPLAGAQVSVGPKRPPFTTNGAGLTLRAARLAACQIALLHALPDPVLLHTLTRVEATLALGGRSRHSDCARQ